MKIVKQEYVGYLLDGRETLAQFKSNLIDQIMLNSKQPLERRELACAVSDAVDAYVDVYSSRYTVSRMEVEHLNHAGVDENYIHHMAIAKLSHQMVDEVIKRDINVITEQDGYIEKYYTLSIPFIKQGKM
jgi:hypothetical protein